MKLYHPKISQIFKRTSLNQNSGLLLYMHAYTLCTMQCILPYPRQQNTCVLLIFSTFRLRTMVIFERILSKNSGPFNHFSTKLTIVHSAQRFRYKIHLEKVFALLVKRNKYLFNCSVKKYTYKRCLVLVHLLHNKDILNNCLC